MTEYEKFLERKTKEYGDRFIEPWGAEKFARFYHDPTRIRVRTTYPSGDTFERTGTVGLTTGFHPAFLLMHRSNDVGSWDVIDERDEITAVRWNGRTYEPVTGRAYAALPRTPEVDPTLAPVSQAISQPVSQPEKPTPGSPSPLPFRETYEYRVTWSIDVGAYSHEDAAREALEIMRDPDSTALVFEVDRPMGGAVIDSETIDLTTDDRRPA